MYCMNCGTMLPDNANFCSKCGSNVGAVRPVQQAQPASRENNAWVMNSGVVNPNPDPLPGYETYNPRFHLKCEYCYYEFDYHTYDLGHRSWYPHGFVYCPRCNKPLKHRMENEVLNNVVPQNNAYMPPTQPM